jgi:hypothetical protein
MRGRIGLGVGLGIGPGRRVGQDTQTILPPPPEGFAWLEHLGEQVTQGGEPVYVPES